MDWKPDRYGELPLQEQIVRYFKEGILRGEWTVGARLPSQRSLARLWQVNRSTVAQAMAELAALGLVEGQTGGGTRVVNESWSLLTALPTDWVRVVGSGRHQPNLPVIQTINRMEADPGIIRLGTGELAPDLLPEREMGRLLQESGKRPVSLGYEEPKGSAALRHRIAERLRERGIHVTADSVLVVSGALQGLHLIAAGLMRPGSTVLTESPSYLHSVQVFQSAGIRLEGVPMDEAGLRSELLERYRKQYQAAMLYTNPAFHNPTGKVMSGKRRKEVLQACQELRLPIIEDDVYGELWLDEPPPPPPIKSMDSHGDVLYLGSLSKSVSPGLRIGWVVGPRTVIDRLADIKMQIDYGASSLSQWAALQWLEGGRHERHLEQLRTQLRQRRAVTAAALDREFGGLARWTIPGGGFYIWLEFNRSLPMKLLFDAALREGVLLNPGTVYGAEEKSCLRISYSYAPPEQLSRAIEILARLVRRLMEQP
ncbi:PLP-dependent aminotransferase family protein [Paenibacillus sp. YN15]|uniref:aminotransferase-like domain-containing protein n=1 Tax=Paenibacillus sp. YN15 TaxID=1742774 RepID=UPI000DCD0602|nr:PLP-dependent aminotransferase family protein [Paenibacillus sp. YN15]RAU91530.1 PLP-dependent aminotransferase family protein [Paenibacillus sp. YN15]